ncbi:ATP-binding protein [Streptomyces sp. NPDC050161]|uniref:ATP-binding protein n=1 Tax=Streptomyces sp. NPDC050161 TaxID=3365604 RepID=UPI003799AFB5
MPTGESVGEARRRVVELVRGWCLGFTDDELADIRLLTSEVVANAVTHAVAACAVCVRTAAGGGVRVEVSDTGPELPHLTVAGSGAEAGRGLQLVAALATAWGVTPGPDGKVVWFEAAPASGPPRAHACASPRERRAHAPIAVPRGAGA